MPSKLSPENQCPVWEQKIGHTLLTVASALPDRCAARFKVHLSSCDILVHAHHEDTQQFQNLARKKSNGPNFCFDQLEMCWLIPDISWVC